MTAETPEVRSPRSNAWGALRAFRFLLIVYGIAAVAAGWEFVHRDELVDLYLDPERSFADAVGELYPDNPGVHQLRTRQLMLCASLWRSRREMPPGCRQFGGKNILEEARRHFERGRQHGKHIEDLYYDYVQFLRGTGAPQAEIDQAYAEWREKFPLSKRPDPR